MMLDRRARFFDERRVADTGGTGRLASHAAETGIEVRDHAVVHRHPPLGPGLHHVNAAARRIHFLPDEDVAWTRRQAEAAVDALVDERLERRQRFEFVWRQSHGARFRFRMLCGSKRALTARITGSA